MTVIAISFHSSPNQYARFEIISLSIRYERVDISKTQNELGACSARMRSKIFSARMRSKMLSEIIAILLMGRKKDETAVHCLPGCTCWAPCLQYWPHVRATRRRSVFKAKYFFYWRRTTNHGLFSDWDRTCLFQSLSQNSLHTYAFFTRNSYHHTILCVQTWNKGRIINPVKRFYRSFKLYVSLVTTLLHSWMFRIWLASLKPKAKSNSFFLLWFQMPSKSSFSSRGAVLFSLLEASGHVSRSRAREI